MIYISNFADIDIKVAQLAIRYMRTKITPCFLDFAEYYNKITIIILWTL
jgi:hypothetical protein